MAHGGGGRWLLRGRAVRVGAGGSAATAAAIAGAAAAAAAASFAPTDAPLPRPAVPRHRRCGEADEAQLHVLLAQRGLGGGRRRRVHCRAPAHDGHGRGRPCALRPGLLLRRRRRCLRLRCRVARRSSTAAAAARRLLRPRHALLLAATAAAAAAAAGGEELAHADASIIFVSNRSVCVALIFITRRKSEEVCAVCGLAPWLCRSAHALRLGGTALARFQESSGSVRLSWWSFQGLFALKLCAASFDSSALI